MSDIYFTRNEANHKLGRRVRSLSTIGSVAEGTEGSIVKVIRSHADQWSIRVRWQTPRPVALIDVAEFSFFKREQPIVSEFSKSEYEKSIKEIS
jgi:hypothetical protein